MIRDDGTAPNTRPWLVDVHTHAIDPDLPDLSRSSTRVPTTSSLPDGRIQVHFDGRPYRVMDQRSWSAAARLADMDTLGVQTQVVSPFPITYCHDIPADTARQLARYQNRFLEGFQSHPSNRFAVLGAVPLQDAQAAADELKRCVNDLGFAGVAIGTEVAGARLSDPALTRFWSAADALEAVILIHPVDHCVDPRIHDAGLGFGLGMPTETALAGLDLLRAGTLDAYPGASVCLAHGGGSLPAVLGRTAFGQALAASSESAGKPVAHSAARLWVDSITYDAETLAAAARQVGAGHVVFGSDYPGAAPPDMAASALNNLGLGEDFAQAVGRDNATGLLSRDQRTRPESS